VGGCLAAGTGGRAAGRCPCALVRGGGGGRWICSAKSSRDRTATWRSRCPRRGSRRFGTASRSTCSTRWVRGGSGRERELKCPARHQTWLRDPVSGQFLFDVFREPHEGGTWICRRHTSLRLPYDAIIERTSDGIPYLVPELVLLSGERGGVGQGRRVHVVDEPGSRVVAIFVELPHRRQERRLQADGRIDQLGNPVMMPCIRPAWP
jgi:hypothetical protein